MRRNHDFEALNDRQNAFRVDESNRAYLKPRRKELDVEVRSERTLP